MAIRKCIHHYNLETNYCDTVQILHELALFHVVLKAGTHYIANHHIISTIQLSDEILMLNIHILIVLYQTEFASVISVQRSKIFVILY